MSELDNKKNIARTLVGTAVFIGVARRFGLINTLFYGAFAITAILFILIYLMHKIENIDYDITWDKVKAGDSLYYKHDAKDTSSSGFNPQILIRPINKADIEKMHIANWKKKKLINEIDSTLAPQFVDSKYKYMTDSMYKYGTAFIGIFVKKDTLKELGVKDAFGEYWYTFIPNKLHRDCCYIQDIPKGYIVADNHNMYVPAGWVRLEEQKAFIPFKKKLAISPKPHSAKILTPVTKTNTHNKKKTLRKRKNKHVQ